MSQDNQQSHHEEKPWCCDSVVEEAEALAKKTEATKKYRRKREALAPSDQAVEVLPPQGVSYASTLGSTFDKTLELVHMLLGDQRRRKGEPQRRQYGLFRLQTPSIKSLQDPEFLRLERLPLGGLQISGRSTLQQISGNAPPQLAPSHREVFLQRDRDRLTKFIARETFRWE